MNHNTYRIVFNASRGLWMAVAETATSHGKQPKTSRAKRSKRAGRKAQGQNHAHSHPTWQAVCQAAAQAVFGALALAAGSLGSAHAQIVANPAAPGTQQATVLQSAGGVPLVNIQTPNAQGVSMNRYSQFDVQANGAVLNNSRQNVQTQLAGWVQGNPWLATGSAGIIVNQVDSSQPSLLRGYTEVAGQRASVVIANPAGIAVSGGGFINANGVTLTTGTPQWAANGQLAGYGVQGGQISVTGLGLDASASNYAQLLARAVSINAGIWAQDLQIVAGNNTISATKDSNAPAISAHAADGSTAPQFAVDVGQLGGMYAGQIFLVGTEAGLGVNNAGTIAASKGLSLSADGQLRNSGTIAATSTQHSAQFKASNVDNSGGIIVANADLAMTSTATQGVGINNSAGKVYAQGSMALDAAHTSIVNTAGSLLADQNLTLQSGAALDNTNGELYAGANVAIVDSRIAAGAAQHSAEQDIINQAGSIHANQNLNINSRSLSNSGSIGAVGGLNAALAGNYTQGADGKLAANGQLTLASLGTVFNQGQIIGGSSAAISAAGIDNQVGATIAAAGAIHMHADDALNNRGLMDGSNTHIQAQTLNNLGTGRIYGDHVVVQADTVNNAAEGASSAVIAARGDLDIAAREVHNSGGATLLSLQNMRVGGGLDGAGLATGQAQLINNAGSLIQSGGDMSLAANTINNSNPDLRITPLVEISRSQGGNLYQVPGEVPADASGFVMVYRGYIYPYAFGGRQSRAPDTRLVRPVHPELFGTFIDQAIINNPTCTGPFLSQTCVNHYSYATADSPLWAQFNMTPPANFRTTEPQPTEFGAVKNIWNDTYRWNSPQDKANYDAAVADYQSSLAALGVLNNAITAQNQINNAIDGYGWRDYTYITGVTHITSEDQIAASTPGQISAGGNLHLNGTLNNTDSSVMAAGNITAVGGAVNNLATQGQRSEVTQGTADYVSWEHEGGAFGCDCDEDSHSYAPFKYTVSTTFVLPTLTYAAQQAVGAIGAIAANGNTGSSVSATGSGFTLPSSSLYAINTSNPNAPLIETDPAFTNRGLWLSSDYMLQQLGADPSSLHRRLGDGYYEQQLLLQQIAQLKGQRLLGDYSSVDAQYQALMNAGITFAKAQQLRVGVALTAEQIAALTSDIIWLVNQTITLPDGSVQTVLVPQLYAVPQNGDLAPNGALLAAGGSLHISSAGDIRSTGDLAARRVLHIEADNIHTANGRITAQQIDLAAQRDIQVIGASVQAAQTLLAQAGGDITVRSTSSSTQGSSASNGTSSSYSNTSLDRTASLSVTGQSSGQGSTTSGNAAQNGQLILLAAGNTQLQGARISNQAAGGSTVIQTGGDLRLDTVQTQSALNINYGGGSHLNTASSAEVGTQINTQGDMHLQAGGNITARAAQVDAGGDLSTQAGGNIAISAGQASQTVDDRYYRKDSGFLSSSSRTIEDFVHQSTAQASSLGGKTITVQAGQDLSVTGSHIISDSGTALAAQNNITIEAATNTANETHFRESKTSGVFSSGGMGVTIGKQQQSLNQQGASTSAAASTVGSIAGNTTIVAGKQYTQTGSDVLAPKGDITIAAQNIQIQEARETGSQSTEQKFKQSGLTVAVGNPVISALQTANQMSQAAGSASDGRMQALAAASTAMAAKDAVTAVQAGQQTQNANAADKAGGVSLSVSLGSGKSQSSSQTQSNTARGSTVQAGGDVSIVATGAAPNSALASDLTIQGSTISAGQTATLAADHHINLLAAQNTASQSSHNSSSSGSIGVSFNLGAQTGISVGVSASKGKGNANGSDTTYTNTHIAAGEKISLQSGADISLKGAVVTAPQVQAQVGGNLQIESLQDTATYTERQKSAGGSLSVGLGPTGVTNVGGSISSNKTHIDADYQAVQETSAIRAGDGGFQINTAGDTTLIGGQITSTQKAIDDNKNSFSTGGTLSTQDLRNTADYSASSSGFSAGISVGLGQTTDDKGAPKPAGKPSGSAGSASDAGQAQSTTKAGISGVAASGNSQVRTEDQEQALQNIFDADRVKKEVEAQVQITQAFQQQAPKLAADIAANQAKNLRAAGDEEEAQKWEEGGIYRTAMHTAIGALAGGSSGAVAAGGIAAAAPFIDQLQSAVVQNLQEAGMSAEAAQALGQALGMGTAAAIGAATGGSTGAGTAFSIDTNNRQLHPTEIQWIKQNAKRYAKQLGISEASAEKLLAEQAFRQVQFGVEGGIAEWDAQAAAFLKQAGSYLLPGDPNIPGQNVGYMFYATSEQRANASMYLASTQEYADFYKQNGLKQPTVQELTSAAQHNAELRANLSTATKTAIAASATVALAGLSPAMLQWALSNPIAATQAGIISAETAAAIVSGAVMPSGLLQQVSNPQAAKVVYNRLAAAATQNPLSDEVVLGRYLINNASSYEKVAQSRGATYYEVAAWDGINKELGSREKMWEINKAFLDKAIDDGKKFIFTSDPKLFPSSSDSRKEYEYLIKNGYNFELKGGLYHATK